MGLQETCGNDVLPYRTIAHWVACANILLFNIDVHMPKPDGL